MNRRSRVFKAKQTGLTELELHMKHSTHEFERNRLVATMLENHKNFTDSGQIDD